MKDTATKLNVKRACDLAKQDHRDGLPRRFPEQFVTDAEFNAYARKWLAIDDKERKGPFPFKA